MAILKKKNDTFDVYQLELSYTELMAIQAAGESAGDPVADELSKAISWYLSNLVAPPGVDEHPSKAAKDDPEVDALLPDGAEVEVVPGGGGGDLPAGGPRGVEGPPGAGAPEGRAGPEVAVDDEAEEMLPAP